MKTHFTIPSLLLAIALLLSAVPDVTCEELLSQEDFMKKTSGKTVFIKLFAPWCGHCKEMAPHWERLSKEWENNNNQVLIASVDCTKEEDFCVSLGIEGFPTLLYGDTTGEGAFLETYHGEKTYEALSEFAKETLVQPLCTPGNVTACDEEKRDKVNQLWKLPASDLQAEIDKTRSMIEKEEENFKQAFSSMQAVHDSDSKELAFSRAKLKANMDLLKEVLNKN